MVIGCQIVGQSSRYLHIESWRSSFPASRSLRAAIAVNIFDTDATSCCVSGVNGIPFSTSAYPYPLRKRIRSPLAMSTAPLKLPISDLTVRYRSALTAMSLDCDAASVGSAAITAALRMREICRMYVDVNPPVEGWLITQILQ